ncbi:hypothetical protein PHG11b_13 [Flavobacterium phage 11b]|uniref:hypothetical protein n=1 Tax=Flavobacterium phage 11b TaxID=294631 RepID=UPI000044412B|nr:hypothetical protein PHG11b_13 [Flavobacterium phage 11b]CAH56640.1 hypothetical protein PHG11b_13 [Flavobacterium phage 11b]
MTATIIITAYVLSVFLNRWLNKILCKRDKCEPIMTAIWFIPIASTIVLVTQVIDGCKRNWFTGKNW